MHLLENANARLSQLPQRFVGISTQKVSATPSALIETLLPMACGVDQRPRQHQVNHPDGENGDRDSVWNRTAEAIFHAVISRVPNWWDDHNSIATPSRTTMESFLEMRSLEDDVSLT